LFPLVDAFEFIVTVAITLSIYFSQDTQGSHVILALVTNIPLSLIKLLGFIPLCKFRKSLRRRKCYLGLRITILTFFALAIIGQGIISAMAISTPFYYSNVTFGYCSFCFSMNDSYIAYQNEFISVKNDDGEPLVPSRGVNQVHPDYETFVDYCHQGLTSTNC
jgi:hypothetical protein